MFSKLTESERRGTQLQQTANAAKVEADRTRADLATLQAKYGEATKAVETHGASVAELTGLNEKLTSEKAAAEKQLAQLKQASDLAARSSRS